MVICLERGADLHTAQLMPLPLTVSCFSKIQISVLPFRYWLTRVVPDKGPLNVCVVGWDLTALLTQTRLHHAIVGLVYTQNYTVCVDDIHY